MSDRLTIVRDTAAAHGFEVVGVTSADPLQDALKALEGWSDAGHAAELGYMTRNPPERADPRTLLKTVRSLISVAVNYWTPAPAFEHENRYGRVARYAWGRDYHDIVLPKLDALGADLAKQLGSSGKVRTACDYSPLLERAAAVRAGLGFFGKNTCLLMPRRGSWYFLGEILLDVELPGTEPEETDHCGTCMDCVVACPTDAFVEPFVLDARKCISYLTIEHRGIIASELREAMGAWVFGCDDCQDVCPFNRFAEPSVWPELGPDAGVGQRLDLVESLGIADEETFEARFAATPLSRPGRAGLLRNASIAARNVGALEAVPALEVCCRDAEPVIRGHALWALAGLDAARARRIAEDLVGRDASAFVQFEAEQILDGIV